MKGIKLDERKRAKNIFIHKWEEEMNEQGA